MFLVSFQRQVLSMKPRWEDDHYRLTEQNLIILLDYGSAGNVSACLECMVSTFFPSTTYCSELKSGTTRLSWGEQ